MRTDHLPDARRPPPEEIILGVFILESRLTIYSGLDDISLG